MASRRYLTEKYDSLKWDIENVLAIYDEDVEDRIDEEDIGRVRANIKDKMISIAKELGIVF